MQTAVYTLDRSRQLAPLLREHQDGLLLAGRIREGLKHKVSPEIMKDYFLWYWRNHIKPHFRHEEDILLPYFPPGNKLAQRLRNEHDMIREMMIFLSEEADKRTLTLIADLIVDHISFEEKELFAWLEKELTHDQLEKILDQLEQKPLVCQDEWKVEFWKNPEK